MDGSQISAGAPSPAIGHNQPPELAEVARTEILEREDYQALRTRAVDLVELGKIAPDVATDAAAADVADQIKRCTTWSKDAEAQRVARKEPYLQAGRAVDGVYKSMQDAVEQAKARLQKPLTSHLQRKAAEERAEREAEAKRAREEAQRKAAEAWAAGEGEREAKRAEQAANAAHAAAEAAERDAAAPAAELSRTRSNRGALAGLRTVWVGKLVDRATLDLEALRQHLPESALQTAINSFVKAGGRTLAGAEIREDNSAVVR